MMERSNMSDLERAIHIAIEAHQGQKDKVGVPYILHPLRVMLRFDSDVEMMAAVLHDVVEDSRWTLTDLQEEGFPAQVIEAVDFLTRRKQESYDQFIDRIKPNVLAVKIKLADLEDNLDLKRLREITGPDQERMKKYQAAWLRLKKSPSV
jgi:(p)ppGpp synthase/HD superfamily hydrolase